MVAAMLANYDIVALLVRQGANMGLEDVEGRTARDYATEGLESEEGKKNQDIKTKKKINDLRKILKLLPDEDKDDEINDEETPNMAPHGNRL